ncbi:hypothetical protein NP233_g4788 [Leucocoprinus birnbaumii]|uniref:Uncharacterized protein n=1 Tax=Leucocoprinus birnbaumii TaxID=56174 RepID=A0AAD5VUI2_9AGAR|nr:hypothetical protein NP233_g4788 [Leucocoprinus birnbaumii]
MLISSYVYLAYSYLLVVFAQLVEGRLETTGDRTSESGEDIYIRGVIIQAAEQTSRTGNNVAIVVSNTPCRDPTTNRVITCPATKMDAVIWGSVAGGVVMLVLVGSIIKWWSQRRNSARSAQQTSEYQQLDEPEYAYEAQATQYDPPVYRESVTEGVKVEYEYEPLVHEGKEPKAETV